VEYRTGRVLGQICFFGERNCWKRATVRGRADSRARDHMACAQARTIHVRASALPSESINHEPPPLQRLLLDSTFPLPYQQQWMECRRIEGVGECMKVF
jgi:hypothetical protein